VTSDPGTVNAFGIIAMGALVGMSTDKATLKLGEVFDTLFKSDDRRRGRLVQPVITALEPPSVPRGSPGPVPIRIIGERLAEVAMVRVGAAERKPDEVTDRVVRVCLAKEDVAGVAALSIAVVTADGTASSAAVLQVT
jgi:hypothetical protein